MKRLIIMNVAIISMVFTLSAQSTWTNGIGKLYTYPDSTNVGIGISTPSERLHINNGALKIGNSTTLSARSKNLLKFGDESYVQIGEWEANNTMSFKANNYSFTNGNVGVGTSTPVYKLDINGKMFLRTYEWANATAYSYFHWQCHNLVMGVPAGNYSVTRIDLKSGGSSQGSLFSEFNMYTAVDENNHIAKIHFNTEQHCWINTNGYVGIGTNAPQKKLDVRGAIRADEIYVNTVSGADFVFDKSYKLRPLSEVQNFILQNQHLPEIPSAEEMQTNGVNINELQIQLLQKVEELTLYIIQQDKRIRELEAQIAK